MAENLTTRDLNGTCVVEEHSGIEIKFYLVVVFGSTTAIFSFVQNLLVLYLLSTEAQFRASPLFFMIFIALFDIFIAIDYVVLLAVHVLMDYLESVWLTWLWHSYVALMLSSAKFCMAASSFLIIASTLERFRCAVRRCPQLSSRNRTFYVGIALTVAFAFTGTIYFEVESRTKAECTGRARYGVSMTSLALDYWYRTIWMFYLRNLFLVLLPFAVLAALNAAIVRSLRKRQKRRMERRKSIGDSVSVRAATRITVSIVTVYLVANVLSVIIATWEYIDARSLDGTQFYSFSVDVISILTVISGLLRLPIYTWCNVDFRREIAGIFGVRMAQKSTAEERSEVLLNGN